MADGEDMPSRDNLININPEKKCEVLNSFITEFKSRYPYLSSNQIAKKLDIPQSTLNRIERGKANPTLENILNILIATGNEGQVAEILKVFFPKQKESYDYIFKGNLDTPMLDKKSSEYATSEETFLILQLAFTRSGVGRGEVKERFGTFGLEKLEEMISAGIMYESDDGRIYARHEKVNVSFTDLKKIVCHAIKKCYDSDSGHLSYQTESVNELGVDLIKQELKRTQVQIRKILYNPEYYGDERVFVGLVHDYLMKEEKENTLQ